MIESLARSLAAALPECTAEDIADILLWLSTRPPPEAAQARQESPEAPQDAAPPPGSQPPSARPRRRSDVLLRDHQAPAPDGRAVRAAVAGLSAPAAGDRSLAAAPVLAAFKQVTRPGSPVVDIDATVEATADARRLTVVTTAERERGLDVALVADTSPVMTACRGLVADLENLLRRSGAFRSVSRWSLAPDSLLLRDSAGAERDPDVLIDPWGRRLILIVTDAVADHWYAPGIWRLIERWARVTPTTALHVLPEQYRARSGLADSGLTMRYRKPSGPNSSADIQRSWWNVDEASDAVPLPVVQLTPAGLATWARAVTTGDPPVTAVRARQPPGKAPRQANARFTDEDRVRAFLARASPGARELARLLARAPDLSWPLITVLQARLLPSTGARELAEVLAGGLLVRASEVADGPQSELFRFRPGAGELLRRGTTATQLWDTFDEISGYLEQHVRSGRDIRALIADPAGHAELDAALKPFAALGHSVAARLGVTTADKATSATGTTPADPAPKPRPRKQERPDGKTPRGQLPPSVTIDAPIVLLGAPGSGKTTFAAALSIAFARRDDGWNVIGADDVSSRHLSVLSSDLAVKHRFPAATWGINRYNWIIVGRILRMVRRLIFGRRPSQQIARITLQLTDAAGELSHPDTRSSLREELIDTLVRSRGIVWLFDPVTEFERGDAFDYMSGLFTELAQRMIDFPEWDGYLPHHVAVCVTKFDEPRVFSTAERLGMLTSDAGDPYGFPRVGDDDAREFFVQLAEVSAKTDLVHRTLERFFRPDRIKYFVTSSIGFHVDPRTGTFNPEDFQNYIIDPDSGRGARIRGRIYPINVAEPLLWLAGRLADQEADSAHRPLRGSAWSC